MAEFETDTLAELIRSKHDCLVRLRDLGRKQLELIERGEMTALLDLLAAKQRPLDELRRIERALDPFRHQRAAERRWHSPEQRRRCSAELEECETLLGEIVRQEKRGEEALIRRRDEAARQLEGAHFAGRARQAYNAPPHAQVNQLDLSSDS
jgi:hypothetical protein